MFLHFRFQGDLTIRSKSFFHFLHYLHFYFLFRVFISSFDSFHSLGVEEMTKLWEEWLNSNERWSSSNYVVQLQQTTEHTKLGARRWMTYKEIVSKYQSEEVATCIVEEKRNNKAVAGSHIKRHPDCPHLDVTKLHCGFKTCFNEFFLFK